MKFTQLKKEETGEKGLVDRLEWLCVGFAFLSLCTGVAFDPVESKLGNLHLYLMPQPDYVPLL